MRPEGLSMKNLKDLNGNGTRDLPSCSGVPLPTATQLAPRIKIIDFIYFGSNFALRRTNKTIIERSNSHFVGRQY